MKVRKMERAENSDLDSHSHIYLCFLLSLFFKFFSHRKVFLSAEDQILNFLK